MMRISEVYLKDKKHTLLLANYFDERDADKYHDEILDQMEAIYYGWA